jgi:protein phosphatase
MPLRFCSSTDPGRQRSTNQDALLVDPSLRLFVVADGMGGHRYGDIASRLIVDGIRQFFEDRSIDDDKTWPFGYDVQRSYPANRLKTAILVANAAISAHLSGNESARGMGATLAAVQIEDSRAVFANVGDCRAYLLDGTLKQITHDHSWVAEQVQAGFISAETAKAHPWRHMVTRAIQGDPDLHVDLIEMDLPSSGQILLCSDGLYGGVSDDDIAASLTATKNLTGVCSSLIGMANDRGAPDNVSVIVIEW